MAQFEDTINYLRGLTSDQITGLIRNTPSADIRRFFEGLTPEQLAQIRPLFTPEHINLLSNLAGGGGVPTLSGFESPAGFAGFEEYFKLLTDYTSETLGREKRRREFLDQFMKKRFGISYEQFEAKIAGQAANVAALNLQRAERALAGKLPVSASLGRAIRTGRQELVSGLQRQLGPGALVSSPGIEATTRFAQAATELKEAEKERVISGAPQQAAASSALEQTLLTSSAPSLLGMGLSSALGQERIESTERLGLADIASRERNLLLELLSRERMQRGRQAFESDILSQQGWGNILGQLFGGSFSTGTTPWWVRGLSTLLQGGSSLGV